MNGVLLVDKPQGLTSHDVVDRIRRVVGIRRVGHTGTLDPSATGLLILCLGNATRLSEFLTSLDKVYEGNMRFGITTTSYDMEGEVVAVRPVPELHLAQIQHLFNKFTGNIQQMPPMVSAVKVKGQRLYKLARKGETVERQPRAITVHEFLVRDYQPPDVEFVLRCSSGTYARALCHEVGEMAGCGAALVSLRRTWVGKHGVHEAAPLDELTSADAVRERLLPMEKALDLPEVVVCAKAAVSTLAGGVIERSHLKFECPVVEGWVQIKNERGELIALGEVQPGRRIQPRRVLAVQSS